LTLFQNVLDAVSIDSKRTKWQTEYGTGLR